MCWFTTITMFVVLIMRQTIVLNTVKLSATNLSQSRQTFYRVRTFVPNVVLLLDMQHRTVSWKKTSVQCADVRVIIQQCIWCQPSSPKVYQSEESSFVTIKVHEFEGLVIIRFTSQKVYHYHKVAVGREWERTWRNRLSSYVTCKIDQYKTSLA